MIRVYEKSEVAKALNSASNIAKAARCKPSLSEADVTKQICGFLEVRGWILKRQQSGLFQRPGSTARVRIGEVGEADWQAVLQLSGTESLGAGICALFYFEVKAPHKLPSFEQSVWLETRRRLGFEADWFDSIGRFEAWYSQRFA